MSHEKHITVHEKHETTHLSSEELRAHHEKLERARNESLQSKEKDAGSIEAARTTAEAEAMSSNELNQPKDEKPQVERRNTKADKEHAFKSVMHHVRQDMSRSEQAFSKIIHQPTIERVSEVAGKTVARPSGVMGAAIATMIGLLTVYGFARFAGFQLSGSEMPLLLVIGFVLGLLAEWIFKAVRALLIPSRS